MRTLLLMALVLGAPPRSRPRIGTSTRGSGRIRTGWRSEPVDRLRWGDQGGLWRLPQARRTPSQKVLLGFESLAWGREDGGTDKTRGNAHFVAQFYPVPPAGSS